MQDVVYEELCYRAQGKRCESAAIGSIPRDRQAAQRCSVRLQMSESKQVMGAVTALEIGRKRIGRNVAQIREGLYLV